MGKVNHQQIGWSESVVTDVGAIEARAVRPIVSRRKPHLVTYASLLLFIVVYCARPGDWIPWLSDVPLAIISGALTLLALMFSFRQFRHSLPREVVYLILLVGQLLLAAVLSSVWRGGAVKTTFDFSKVLIIVIAITVAVNTYKRLRLLIVVQAASVAMIAVVAIVKGRLLLGRLEGMLGGNYSNPNDLALAIVISLPLCLALLFLTRNRVLKVAWALALLMMVYAVFLTGSRGGFLSLIVVAAVCLWEFAIRGRRYYLLVLAALAGVILWESAGGMLAGRLNGTFNSDEDVASAYGSAQARQELFWRSVEVTTEHPLFGVGPGNFQVVSGSWHVTHNSFTEMSSEGGVPALILYALILWSGFTNLRAAKRLARGQIESRLLARAFRASLAGFVVGSCFASVAYQFFPYFLVTYTTALLLIAKESAVHTTKSESVRQEDPEIQFGSTIQPEISWRSS